ncbi:DUF4198 domain-containing protein [Allopontixanthobacter sediminis]|uniref:DUF4198 domain-containing protein n=1 Tax=Allopontixanthobacter sediminis TaxID=1689985 RepID=A0A845BBB7_9SPHN|nr:DUF4198 domain-containing protein [Allopontixanthobacter sediminis]MXP44869.1 DUF4198 domain-containing protein [Allopontixanthobacter sediminis]
MLAKPGLLVLGLALGLSTLLPSEAEAHRRWLLPSSTVLAGESDLVTVDAAASNGLFLFDHRPMALDSLVITGPDGAPVDPTILGAGAYRSMFDVPLRAQGTYRIALVSDGVMGSYELNGERHRFRGSGDALPAGATNISSSRSNSRTETFVTLGAPTDTALQPTGSGLEMIPVTHPNDIVAGEPAVMCFLLDGQPAADLEVEFVAGGTRYRDEPGIVMLRTDAEGRVTLQPSEAGMYYLEVSSSQDAANGQPGRRASYTAVLEFLPL